MLADRLEGKWIDLFAEVFALCKVVAPGDACAILSETQSRALNVQLAELALLRLGARPFHVVVPTPRQKAPVPIRSTGAAAALSADGWFRTCDLARVDDEGFYWIMGRSKALIVSGGENVYPAELENVLAECPQIAESAVLGIEDAKWGEAACAVVVRKPGAKLDEAAVLALFAGRLARFKHPRRVVFVDQLPKNALGKVQKSELRKLL